MNPGSSYRPGREIARGGMGAVLDARDNKLARSVAMKVMLRHDASEEETQRFQQEARVLGQLAHPNIVPVHDLGTDPHGRHFYTMKLVQGVTLHDILHKLKNRDAATLAKHPLSSLVTIFQKTCDAVAFAHSRGIIHRDLKPQNIMVGEFGEVLVMDWGLAKLLPGSAAVSAVQPAGTVGPTGTIVLAAEQTVLSRDAAEQPTQFPTPATPEPATSQTPLVFSGIQDLATTPVTGTQLTLEGTVMGTPNYMSPEQAGGRNADLDERSDIYSLGGVLYAMLTLHPPVEGKDVDELLAKVRRGEIAPPGAASGLPHLPDGMVPEALSAVAMKALQTARSERYQTVAQLADDIAAYQAGFATSAEHAGALRLIRLFLQRHKTLAAAAALIVLLTMGFMAKVISSERKATENAAAARTSELAAVASEQLAKTNETKAVAAEQSALAEKELTRRALAKAQTALADAALRDLDTVAARAALGSVPEDLRDTSWGYLLARSDTSIATLRSVNTAVIRGVAAHPQRAGVFAIAGQDDFISLVEATTGTRLLEFRSGLGSTRSGLYSLAFSHNGEELAVGHQTVAKIAFHSTRDGRKLREWEAPTTHALEFSPAGGRLLVNVSQQGERGKLVMRDAQTGAVAWTFATPSTWTRAALHPSGRSVVVASGSSSVVLLDANDGREIRALPDSGPFVHSIAVSQDGEFAAYGDEQGGIRCARLKDGQLTLDFRAAGCSIRQLHFTPDNRRLVTLTYPDNRSYNHVRVWDARSGYHLQALLGADALPTHSSIHPVSSELVVIGEQTRSWDLTQIEPQWSLPASVNRPWVSFWGGEDTLLYFDTRGLPCVSQLAASGGERILWRAGSQSQRPIASLSADGRFALAGGLSGQFDFFLLQRDGPAVKEIARWKPDPTPRFMRLSPAGDRVWTGSHLLDAATGKQLSAHTARAPSGLFDGHWVSSNRLVTVTHEKEFSLLAIADANTGQTLRSATNTARVLALAVAPGGRLIGEAGQDKLVRLRDPETLAVRREFRAHDDGITALAFHPSETVIATASDDLTMRVWNFETGALLEEMRGPQVIPISLAWSPGGKRLASIGIDRSVRVWEPRSFNTRTTSAPAGTRGEWEFLLAQLKPDDVATNGQGWVFDNGSLRSPDRMYATVPLPGNFAHASYHLMLKVRRLSPTESLTVFFPVAGRQTGFMLDGYPRAGYVSGLHYVDGKGDQQQANAVLGLQVKDSEAHQLDLIVRVGPVTASIEVQLDERPLYRWTGLPTALSMNGRFTGLEPGQLGLGAHKAEWVIQAARVKRL
ncbi:MAG: protein kinase [Limisphaerales bacterium]